MSSGAVGLVVVLLGLCAQDLGHELSLVLAQADAVLAESDYRPGASLSLAVMTHVLGAYQTLAQRNPLQGVGKGNLAEQVSGWSQEMTKLEEEKGRVQLHRSVDRRGSISGKELGRGQAGVVMEETYHGSVAAAKRSLPGAEQALKQERKVYHHLLQHRFVNVVSALHLDDPRRLVLEYVPGRTLRQLLLEDRRWAADTPADRTVVLGLLRGVTAGLVHLHACGVCHGDVHPSNVLVRLSGEGSPVEQDAVLCDLGQARLLDHHRICATHDCQESVHKDDLCKIHHESASCQSNKCRKPLFKNGLCNRHYQDKLQGQWAKARAACCSNCRTTFSLTRRRNHCRNCGSVFCSACCAARVVLAGKGFESPTKVCVGCLRDRLCWQAPEELGGGATAATDVYQFGLLLWEACTRRAVLPQTRASLPATGKTARDVGLLEGWPDRLAQLVQRCLQPSPGLRPSMQQAQEDLKLVTTDP